MKTLVKALATAALAVTASAAQAQLYGEMAYIPLKFSLAAAGSSVEASPKALGLTLGYEFHKNVAVEGLVAFNAGDDTPTDSGATVLGKLKVSNAYGFFVKPKTMLGAKLEVSARLGYMNTRFDISGPGPAGAIVSTSIRDNGFAYGAGARYDLGTHTYLAVNYTSFYNKDDGKVNGFTFGVGMKY